MPNRDAYQPLPYFWVSQLVTEHRVGDGNWEKPTVMCQHRVSLDLRRQRAEGRCRLAGDETR